MKKLTALLVVAFLVLGSASVMARGNGGGSGGGSGSGSSGGGKGGFSSGMGHGSGSQSIGHFGQSDTSAKNQHQTGTRPMDGTGIGYGDGTNPQPKDGTGFGATQQ